MATSRVDLHGGRRKGVVSEGADGNGHDVGIVDHDVEDGGAAGGAEREVDGRALVADAAVDGGVTLDDDVGAGEAGLHAKGAASATLAGVAMTDRDANGFAARAQAQGAARALGVTLDVTHAA